MKKRNDNRISIKYEFGFAICTIFCLLLSLETVNAQHQYNRILVRNDSVHVAAIKKISTDKSGKYVLTCSLDKTGILRDAATGRYLRTFRCAQGIDNEGELYACALSNDGSIAALAGHTHSLRDSSYCIYLYDTKTGEIKIQIDGIGDEIFDLAYSPDGRYLAACMGGNNGLKIFNISDNTLFKEIKNFSSPCNSMAFDINGRLAICSNDGYLYLFSNNFNLITSSVPDKGNIMLSRIINHVCFSPDGSKIAVTFIEEKKLRILNSSNLELLYEPSLDGINDYLNSCVFSQDGNYILAAGNYSNFINMETTHFFVRKWENKKAGKYKDFYVSQGEVLDLKTTEEGDFYICSSFPDFARFSSTGQMKYRFKIQKNLVDNLLAKEPILKVNNSASVINFYTFNNDTLIFDAFQSQLKKGPMDTSSYSTIANREMIKSWKFSYFPKINNVKVDFFKIAEKCYCADISSDSKNIVMGTDLNIFGISGKGKKIWNVPINCRAGCVKISGNNKVVVVGLVDGTFRWYRMSDGKLLLTLYASSDNKHWILYTPSGYYQCAPNSEYLLGWLTLNRSNMSIDFSPISQEKEKYNKPEMIKKVLETYTEF